MSYIKDSYSICQLQNSIFEKALFAVMSYIHVSIQVLFSDALA